MEKSYSKPLVIVTIIMAILVSVLAVALTPQTKLPTPIAINATGQPTMGKANAPVHIVAFEDLKCSNCKRFNDTYFQTIKKEYIATGIAKYTMITLAFIPGSIPAGNAALCLYNQNKNYFFPFVQYVYDRQPPEEENWATIPTLLKFAKSSVPKANLTALSNCIFTDTHTQTLENNLNLAASIMNPVETPTVYVNGRIVQPLTMNQIKILVDAAQEGR